MYSLTVILGLLVIGAHGNLYVSRNVSTVEGDVFQVDEEVDTESGRVIVHSVLNGNSSQTVVTDHTLNIRVYIPHSETEDCHYTDLKEEKTEHRLEGNTDGVVDKEADVVTQNVNASDETSCRLKEDDPTIPAELLSTLKSLCGTRNIRHVTEDGECTNIPQEESQDSEDKTGGALTRRKRGAYRCSRYRYRCYWYIRRVCSWYYKRVCRWFCYFKRYYRCCNQVYRRCGWFCY